MRVERLFFMPKINNYFVLTNTYKTIILKKESITPYEPLKWYLINRVTLLKIIKEIYDY